MEYSDDNNAGKKKASGEKYKVGLLGGISYHNNDIVQFI